jgi:hypothetical protein
VTQNVSEMNPCPDGANYAATGKLLAVSDFFPSVTAYVTVPVGYGGLIYDLLNIGNIITLQVLPQPNNTTSTAATTVTTSGQNSTSGWLIKIPQENEPQSKTGKVVSEQGGVEGQRKEVNVESYSKVAKIGQILKDIEFPVTKQKILEHIKQLHSDSQENEVILEKLEKLEERECRNVSDITMAAGLVY